MENSIELIKQVGNCLKSVDERDKTFKEQGTQKIKILN